MAGKPYDVIVVGGGPGGYVAAIRARQLGMSAALVEAADLGGICLNWGCIPTKALLRSAEVYDSIQDAAEFGLKVTGASFDMADVVKRSRGVAERLSKGIGFLMKKNKVDVVMGRAKLADRAGKAWKIAVTGADGKAMPELQAHNIILATGARARELPSLPVDGKLVWSYREAMVPKSQPKSLLVVGSGAIGVEFASFYASMGTRVTIIEALERILPVEDPEISMFVAKALKKRGLEIITGKTIDKLESLPKSGVRVMVAGKAIEVDAIISAVGIVGNVENLGLEGLKVRVEKTHIVTDGLSRTGEAGLFAIGDVAGPPWLAHKASHEGILCVEGIAGLNPHPICKEEIPGCTYSHPQVASVGLTEEAAKAQGCEVRVGRFAFAGNGKAIALGDPNGMIKTIFDKKTGELLGAHMVGPEVTELIQGYAVAMKLEATEEDLFHTVFPHPTLSEMMHESALDAFGRAVHQ